MTLYRETRTMSGDREIRAEAADNGKGGASERADDQRALTTQSAGAEIFECATLSPRECGILELIGQGYSNKRVARALGITAETVKSHVKRVFIKLDVKTRAHAVARAQSLGLFALQFVRRQNTTSARKTVNSISAGEVHESIPKY